MAYLMLIDDDEDFATAAAKVLTDAGHDVQIQLTTKGALEGIERRRPDLVILDVMFPEDSSAGFKLARAIRQTGKGSAPVPILMLTAVNAKFPLGFSSRDIDATWLPVNDFLEKPMDFEVLRNRVAAFVSGEGARAGNRDAHAG